MLRRPASQKAFTLIEVLMAATVLVVSFTAVIQAVTMGAAMIDTARKQQIAQQIIDGEISGLRLGKWSDITALADGISYTLTVSSDGLTCTGPVSKFFLDGNADLMLQAKNFAITETASTVRTDFRTVTYIATWTSAGNRTHTRTNTAYFGLNGLHLSYKK